MKTASAQNQIIWGRDGQSEEDSEVPAAGASAADASDLEGGGGFGRVGLEHDGTGAIGGIGAELRGGGIADFAREAGAGVEGEDEEGLEAGGDAGLVG